MPLSRISIILAAAAVALVALAPAAQARHHRHHNARAITVRPVPAHQRPEWVGLVGAPLPGLVDVGLGPVFPFGGWPK